MASQFLSFNVGGKAFTTTRDTILKEPSSRLALLVRGVLPATTAADGSIFLDRQPQYFHLILNYLRDGWCSLPKTTEERRELMQEVRYFQLTGMEAWLRTQDEAAVSPAGSPLGHRPGSSSANISSRPAAVPLRANCSFLTGPNQDPLAAGASPYSSSSGGGAGGLGACGSPGSPEACYSYPSSFSRPCSASQQQHAFAPAEAFHGSGVMGSAAGSVAAYPHNTGFSVGCYATPPPLVDRRLMAVALEQSPRQLWDSGDWMMARQAQAAGTGYGQPAGAGDQLPRRYWQATAAVTGQYAAEGPGSQFKWTSRYLQSNPKMQAVVDTLIELARLPPHPSMHTDKVTISFSSECDHDRVSSLLGPARTGLEPERFRCQVIRVKGSSWSFEFSLRPSSDLALFEKFNLAEFVQDNWFVLAAVLKDSFGVAMEEDKASRPNCVACRRSNVSITLQQG